MGEGCEPYCSRSGHFLVSGGQGSVRTGELVYPTPLSILSVSKGLRPWDAPALGCRRKRHLWRPLPVCLQRCKPGNSWAGEAALGLFTERAERLPFPANSAPVLEMEVQTA